MLFFQSLNENLKPFYPTLPIPFFFFKRINLGLQFLVPSVVFPVSDHEIVLVLRRSCILFNPFLRQSGDHFKLVVEPTELGVNIGAVRVTGHYKLAVLNKAQEIHAERSNIEVDEEGNTRRKARKYSSAGVSPTQAQESE